MLVMLPTLKSLVNYAWDFENKNASQVFLIPFVSLGLLVMNRSKIFSRVEYAVAPAMLIAICGAGLWFASRKWGAQLVDGDRIGLETGALIVFWIAAFMGFYGSHAFRAALFPLLFLIFSVPLPSIILDPLVALLRRGSADISYLLLKMSGTPVYREGFVFAMPRLRIEVADECSGIRSCISMLILTVLGGNLLLESWWRRILLVVIALPVMLFKNALRIMTLSLLSIYVNPGFMEGRLHTEGGIPFFLVALVLLYPVAMMLIRSERRNLPTPASL
jgi:exosortase